jgi:SAM-dependent methyltransferase
MLAPRRRRGVELLDDAAVPDDVRARALDDVARSNRWLGGRRALRFALDEAIRTLPRDTPATLLDLGVGAGDLSRLARARARRAGVQLRLLGADLAPSLALAARREGASDLAIGADAVALPFATASVDIVVCSQLLHHFEHRNALRVLAEMDRVARRCVIVADLRRSWLAAIGFWLVAWPLRFHRVTRHDGVVSVLRGFTARELRGLVREATRATPEVRHRLGWRLIAIWKRDPAIGGRTGPIATRTDTK